MKLDGVAKLQGYSFATLFIGSFWPKYSGWFGVEIAA